MFSNTIPVVHTMNAKLATCVHPLDMQQSSIHFRIYNLMSSGCPGSWWWWPQRLAMENTGCHKTVLVEHWHVGAIDPWILPNWSQVKEGGLLLSGISPTTFIHLEMQKQRKWGRNCTMIQTKQVQRLAWIGYRYQVKYASQPWKTKTLQDPDHFDSMTKFLLQLKPSNLWQTASTFT
jgi:hypothetical protein